MVLTTLNQGDDVGRAYNKHGEAINMHVIFIGKMLRKRHLSCYKHRHSRFSPFTSRAG